MNPRKKRNIRAANRKKARGKRSSEGDSARFKANAMDEPGAQFSAAQQNDHGYMSAKAQPSHDSATADLSHANLGDSQTEDQDLQSPKNEPSGTGRDGDSSVEDENLLQRARTQWQFGDWESLAQLQRDKIEHHPNRANLALLAAAGRLQTGADTEARQYVQIAQDWGAGKKLISQVLIAGVHCSLGRVRLANTEDQRAHRHFEDSIRWLQPDADREVATGARLVREAVQLGLLAQATRLMDTQFKNAKARNGQDHVRMQILETEIELLHHELSLAQQRQQLFTPKTEEKPEAPDCSDEWKDQLKQQSVSQLGQDIWVLEKTDYKIGGFFVEFGATDGVLLSNTWLLEKAFRWQGICAEPNPGFFEQLQNNRCCTLSKQCIGEETGKEVEFVFADVYGGMQEYADNDQHKEKRTAYRAAGQVATLTTISLHDFLQQCDAPRDIDYISIDTEGSEYEILRAFPFEKWNIQLFTVEHNFTEQRKDIRKLLEDNGYRCQEARWDDWFQRIDS